MGPDYVTPGVDAPATWVHAQSSEIVQSNDNLSDISWWENFNDPKLDELIDQALAKNNNIQVAIGNIGVAEAQLKQVHMNWVPTINLGGAALSGQLLNFSSNSNNSMVTGINPGNSSFTFYQAGLVPTYSLNILKQIKNSELAKANLAGAKAVRDAIRLTIISQVAGSYFSLLALDQQLREQKQVVADLVEVVRLAKIQYKHGYVALTDIKPYEQQLEQSKMAIPNIEDNIVHMQNALKVLLGKNPGNIVRNNNFNNISLDNKIPINLPSEILRNRPDIRQAEEQLKATNADIGVAKSNYFPSITLTTPAGAFSSQLAGLFNNPSGDFWFAQILATMPILNLGLNALIKEKKAKYYVAYYTYIQTVKAAFADTDNSLSSAARTADTYITASKMYKVARENAALNLENYHLGYMSYPDSLSSKITADNTKILLTQAKLQQVQAILKVYQAMAGGYNYKNTDKPTPIDDEHNYD